MNLLMQLQRSWLSGPRRGTRRGLARRRGCPELRLEPLEGRLLLSDGTGASTVLVKDINPGSASSYPRNLTNLNGTLLFAATDGTTARLQRSNGTAAGTVLVKDVVVSFFLRELPQSNGNVFFSGDDGPTGFELWKSDGTAAGTVLVKDIYPGNTPSGPNASDPGDMTDVNGTLFFTANDGTHGRELWKSDGTAAGTVLVKDINPGSGGSDRYGFLMANVNGTVFFRASADGTANGMGLWKSDGSTAGTVLVKKTFVAGGMTNVNGTLFFAGDDGRNGTELWKSDGTASGTKMVKDIYSGSTTSCSCGYYCQHKTCTTTPNSSSPGDLTNLNGTLFFTANDGPQSRGLWKSDGTAAGTALVKNTSPPGPNSAQYMRNVNGTLFFSANDWTTGDELWKSDGTAAGTVLVKDINPGGGASHPTKLTNANGTLYFVADDGTHGRELWKSDGTANGTVLVKDINPGAADSILYYLTLAGGHLFFSANDGVHGAELWDPPVSPSTEEPVVLDDAPRALDPPRVGAEQGGITIRPAFDGATTPTVDSLAPSTAVPFRSRTIPATVPALWERPSQILLSPGDPGGSGARDFTGPGDIDQAIAVTLKPRKSSRFGLARAPLGT